MLRRGRPRLSVSVLDQVHSTFIELMPIVEVLEEHDALEHEQE
jgi:hypothetical protein